MRNLVYCLNALFFSKVFAYPIGFFALWKSFNTRSTSLFTLQFSPSTANVHLKKQTKVINTELSFFLKFLLDRGPFCGATGSLRFRLGMTLPMSFKARVGSLLPALFSCLHATIKNCQALTRAASWRQFCLITVMVPGCLGTGTD